MADALHRWLLARSWSELAWIERHKPRAQVSMADGHRFAVLLDGYWDMDAWQSDLTIRGNVHRLHLGRRACCRHRVVVDRWGEDLPVDEPKLRDPRLTAWATTL